MHWLGTVHVLTGGVISALAWYSTRIDWWCNKCIGLLYVCRLGVFLACYTYIRLYSVFSHIILARCCYVCHNVYCIAGIF